MRLSRSLPSLAVAAVALPVIPFLMPTCGSETRSPVRAPTTDERAKIVRAVNWTWEYVSTPMPSGHDDLQLRRPPLRPKVVRLIVARADPRYASAVVELRDARGRRHRSPAVMVFERIENDKWSEKEFGAYTVAGPAVVFRGACTPGLPKGLRTLLCPDPWTVLRYPRPHIRLQTRLTQPIPSPDLHTVDWKTVALPGGVCGSSRPIRPRWQGAAAVHPEVDLLWWNPVWVYSWDKPVFGDLDGDGRDEAALHVGCANGGGTAAGQLAFSEVVFEAVGTSLRVVGIVKPQQPVTADAGHVPLIWTVAIQPGKVIAPEYWYGPYDGSCCASGQAKTLWAYDHGTLRKVRTTTVEEPWTSRLYFAGVLLQPGDHELRHYETTKVPYTPRLRVGLVVGTFGADKHNVEITLTIRQSSKTIVRTTTVKRISGIGLEQNVVFPELPPIEPGQATVTVDAHDPGAHPLRYEVVFTRG